MQNLKTPAVLAAETALENRISRHAGNLSRVEDLRGKADRLESRIEEDLAPFRKAVEGAEQEVTRTLEPWKGLEGTQNLNCKRHRGGIQHCWLRIAFHRTARAPSGVGQWKVTLDADTAPHLKKQKTLRRGPGSGMRVLGDPSEGKDWKAEADKVLVSLGWVLS
jgi:hypothetical protein